MTPRPALAYVVNALNAGGTERLVVEMSLAFAQEYDITVFCLDEPGVWAERLRTRGVSVHCLWRQPGLDLSIPYKLARAFRAQNTRLVHAHQCTPWFYAALSRLIFSAPRLLFQEHGRFFPEIPNPKRAWVNRVLIRKLTHRFIAVSQDIRARLVQYEGLDEAQIEVIYNGVEAKSAVDGESRMRLRASLGLRDDEFVVGAVGRFDPIKNLPLLIESLARVRNRGVPFRAVLVGDGPAFGEVADLVRSHNLDDRVLLTGYREDSRALMECLDLYVLCSFSEGTSMALLEAMAAGVPAAVTAVGGNPELVLAGGTGWVVPSDNVPALADAIEDAWQNRAKRMRFAQAGSDRFRAHFEFGRMIDGYRAAYEDLLETASARPVERLT